MEPDDAHAEFKETSQMWSKKPLMVAALALAFGLAFAHEGKLSATDVRAIETTLERFRDAWLRNDANDVMDQLTDDAIIMPHHGVAPKVGAAAIRAFWWPERSKSPPATVTRFEQSHDEIGGEGDLAYVRGHSTVEYIWGEPGKERRYRDVGTSLTLLRKTSAGAWKISHRMWDDPPTENLGPVAP